jgi:hypothetical protein
MTKRERIEVTRVLTSLFPTSWLQSTARSTGAVRRSRKVNPATLFWTLVLGFGIGQKRSLASLRRQYELSSRSSIEESSFYQRFNEGLVKLLRAAVKRGLEELRPSSKASRRVLGHFRDLLLFDATVIRLHDLLYRAYRGTRTNHSRAAAKLHMVYNVVRSQPQRVMLTRERAADCTPWKRIGRWVKGSLLVFDRAYFSYPLLSRIAEQGGYFLIRMKKSVNPLITGNNRSCRGRSISLVGRKLLEVLPYLKREVLARRGRSRGEAQRWPPSPTSPAVPACWAPR